MKRSWNDTLTGLKGFAMGAANVVPGVSGGTIALLTGIYGEIIDALDALATPATWRLLFRGDWRGFWQRIHGRFLLALGIGVVASIFSLAKLMTWLLDRHPVQTWAFFFGLIVASALYLFADLRIRRPADALWALLGTVLGVVTCTLTPTATPDGLWFIFLCGAIAVCTMILPGISGSFILVILSKYEYIMDAVARIDLPILAVFALGCIAGILAFAKFLHWLLDRARRPTLLVLTGFVLGALVKVWPWNDPSSVAAANLLNGDAPDALHIPGAILWALAGIALVCALETLGKRVDDH